MIKRKLKATVAIALSISMMVCITGCQNVNDISQKEFSITEESTYDKPMQNQPEAPYWYPNDLLEWNPEKDKDFKYNVSSIPLAQRVEKSELKLSNNTQNPNMKVVALSIMNSSTSGNSPHGINTIDANVFSYWQYIDQLVYWGGSSGEGIIVPPTADVIDVAHKNGVPVLGTIFFPQSAHGGKIEWLDTFLAKDENGNFLIVDKLIEVAKSYGFDGWFINQETEASNEENEKQEGGLTKEHAILMKELIQEFKQKSEDSLDIMWYDSMTKDGKMDWQNALTDENAYFMVDESGNGISDSMFLNFWWTNDKFVDEQLLKSSKVKAEDIGIDPYQLYAGIDVQANGSMTPVRWDLFEDGPGKSFTSLGLYCPSWTYYSSTNLDDFHNKENVFWVNEKGDPTKDTESQGTQWRGISTYSIEQTVITKAPFISNFNLGHGYNFFIDGQKASSMDWNNRSIQDIMPTYRWTIEHENGNRMNVYIDYANAYYGGNSLKVRGTISKDKTSKWKLYSCELPLEQEMVFTTTAKATEDTALDLVLEFSDGKTEVIKGDKNIGNDWTTVTYNLENYIGKTVNTISYMISSTNDSEEYQLNLGQIAITNRQKNQNNIETKITELKVEDTCFDEEESVYAGVRLAWKCDNIDEVSHYEIYRVNKDKTRSFLGATTAQTHYINALKRNDDTNETDFEVVPINKNGKRGITSSIVTMQWPDNSIPKVEFKASTTLAQPNEEIIFESICSSNTESVKWEFEGADIKESTDKSPKVTYSKEGIYSVKLTAKNKSGESVSEIEGFITISKKASEGLKLLSKDKNIEASSYVNENEAPIFAVDGKIDTKWCAVGPAPHEITIDLGDIKTISEVKISHAEEGNESSTMNTKGYSIKISEDGNNFTEVKKITQNTKGNTSDTFPAVSGRFVKLVVDKPTQSADTAARIYEIEVYGLDGELYSNRT